MATYNGSDKRLQYLFQNGGGGGVSECLYDATKINGIDTKVSGLVSSMASAQATLAEILAIIGGGGGGGGSSFEQLEINEIDYLSSEWMQE